jgi:hypothetical protein
MHTVSTIGRDIAKSVFQVHGVDASGLAVIFSGAGYMFAVPKPEKEQSSIIEGS